MAIDVRHEGRACILDVAGAISYPDATAELQTEFKRLLGDGARIFIIDMLDVPWLDSSGIGEVVACFKRAREHGGTVKLVLRDRPFNAFTYCHLQKMFEMFDSLDEAVASIRSDPADDRPRTARGGPPRRGARSPENTPDP